MKMQWKLLTSMMVSIPEYLGKTLEEILEPIDIDLEEFDSICDRFTNKQIFKLDEDGNILKDKNKRPIKLSYDN